MAEGGSTEGIREKLDSVRKRNKPHLNSNKQQLLQMCRHKGCHHSNHQSQKQKLVGIFGDYQVTSQNDELLLHKVPESNKENNPFIATMQETDLVQPPLEEQGKKTPLANQEDTTCQSGSEVAPHKKKRSRGRKNKGKGNIVKQGVSVIQDKDTMEKLQKTTFERLKMIENVILNEVKAFNNNTKSEGVPVCTSEHGERSDSRCGQAAPLVYDRLPPYAPTQQLPPPVHGQPPSTDEIFRVQEASLTGDNTCNRNGTLQGLHKDACIGCPDSQARPGCLTSLDQLANYFLNSWPTVSGRHPNCRLCNQTPVDLRTHAPISSKVRASKPTLPHPGDRPTASHPHTTDRQLYPQLNGQAVHERQLQSHSTKSPSDPNNHSVPSQVDCSPRNLRKQSPLPSDNHSQAPETLVPVKSETHTPERLVINVPPGFLEAFAAKEDRTPATVGKPRSPEDSASTTTDQTRITSKNHHSVATETHAPLKLVSSSTVAQGPHSLTYAEDDPPVTAANHVSSLLKTPVLETVVHQFTITGGDIFTKPAREENLSVTGDEGPFTERKPPLEEQFFLSDGRDQATVTEALSLVTEDDPAPVAEDNPSSVAGDNPSPVAADNPSPLAADNPSPVAEDSTTDHSPLKRRHHALIIGEKHDPTTGKDHSRDGITTAEDYCAPVTEERTQMVTGDHIPTSGDNHSSKDGGDNAPKTLGHDSPRIPDDLTHMPSAPHQSMAAENYTPKTLKDHALKATKKLSPQAQKSNPLLGLKDHDSTPGGPAAMTEDHITVLQRDHLPIASGDQSLQTQENHGPRNPGHQASVVVEDNEVVVIHNQSPEKKKILQDRVQITSRHFTPMDQENQVFVSSEHASVTSEKTQVSLSSEHASATSEGQVKNLAKNNTAVSCRDPTTTTSTEDHNSVTPKDSSPMILNPHTLTASEDQSPVTPEEHTPSATKDHVSVTAEQTFSTPNDHTPKRLDHTAKTRHHSATTGEGYSHKSFEDLVSGDSEDHSPDATEYHSRTLPVGCSPVTPTGHNLPKPVTSSVPGTQDISVPPSLLKKQPSAGQTVAMASPQTERWIKIDKGAIEVVRSFNECIRDLQLHTNELRNHEKTVIQSYRVIKEEQIRIQNLRKTSRQLIVQLLSMQRTSTTPVEEYLRELQELFLAIVSWTNSNIPSVQNQENLIKTTKDLLIARAQGTPSEPADGPEGFLMTHTVGNSVQYSQVTVQPNMIHIHCLQPPALFFLDKTPPSVADLETSVPLECAKLCVDTEANLTFLDFTWCGIDCGRAYLRLFGTTRTSQEFLAMCTGETGQSLTYTVFRGVGRKTLPGEHVRWGHDVIYDGEFFTEFSDASTASGNVLLNRGLVTGCYEEATQNFYFHIYTKPAIGIRNGEPVGYIISGLEIFDTAIEQNMLEQLVIADCGLAIEIADCGLATEKN